MKWKEVFLKLQNPVVIWVINISRMKFLTDSDSNNNSSAKDTVDKAI